MSKWQPIETAPTDGSEFLVFYPAEDGEKAFFEISRYPENPERLDLWWTIGGVYPTHWMPLPEPPKGV